MKNKVLIMVVIIVIILTVCFLCVSAAENDNIITVSVDYSTNKVTVRGFVGKAFANQYALVQILKPGMGLNDLKNKEQALNWVEQSRVNKNGYFIFEMTLEANDDSSGSTYTALVSVGSPPQSYLATFELYGTSYIDSVSSKLTSAITNEDTLKINEIINNYNIILKISNSDAYVKYGNMDITSQKVVCDGLVKEQANNIDTFGRIFEQCVDIQELNGINDPAMYEEMMLSICDGIRASVLNRFSKYSSEEKEDLLAKLMREDYICASDLQKDIESPIILKDVNGALIWTEILNWLEKYNDVLGIDFSKYRNLNKQSVVLQNMLSKDYLSLEKVITAFNEGVENQKRAETGTNGNSGPSKRDSIIVTQSNNSNSDVNRTENTFFDMAGFEWAVPSVERLVKSGAVSGYGDGTFVPTNNVTRAEFVKILVMTFKLTLSKEASNQFSDVSDSDWYSEYITVAVNNGLIKGVSNSEFQPNSPIIREDIAIILNRLIGERLMVGEAVEISDATNISDYAKQAVEKLTASGIIKGFEDGTFKPKGFATRAETAVFIIRAADYFTTKGEN